MLGIAFEVKDHALRFGAGRAARNFAWRVADRLVGCMPYQGFILRASRTRRHATLAPDRLACCRGVRRREAGQLQLQLQECDNIDSGFRYEFPGGWVYHFKAFTLPEWRGQGLHVRHMPVILEKVTGLPGFKGLTTLVVTTNYPSLSFRPVGLDGMFAVKSRA